MHKTPSRTSPKGGRRGCLCEDNTYSSECCDGSLQAQGIGATEGQHDVIINHEIYSRNIENVNEAISEGVQSNITHDNNVRTIHSEH